MINLGTNDVAHIDKSSQLEPRSSVAKIDARLDKFAAEFPSTTCVVFVTLDSHNPGWHPAYVRQINKHIRSTFAHVADWDATLRPADFYLAGDPHPNETGRQVLLAVEDRAIASC